MKFLHTADIHLGAKFRGVTNPTFLRKRIKDTFTKLIDLAIDKKVDFIFISGDLFDSSSPSSDLLKFVSDQFKRFKSHICIIPGTHEKDLYDKIELFRNIGNLTIFRDTKWDYKDFKEFDTTIYGISPQTKTPLNDIKRITNSKYHIALLHAGYGITDKINDEIIVTEEEIKKSGMNYIALGHWHNAACYSKNGVLVFYPGTLEPIAIDQTKSGNVIIVTDMKPKYHNIGSIKCGELSLDISGFSYVNDLKQKILEKADKNLRLKVNLKGVSSLMLGVDLDNMNIELKNEFCELKIINKSTIPLKELDPSMYVNRPFLREFLKLITKEIDKTKGKNRETAEKAREYGLALLEGKEVL